MSLETYWLVIIPALLISHSAIGWVGLGFTRQRRPVASPIPTEFPPDAEGFAVLGDDGKFDPDCIYSDCPADWSRLHCQPVYRVRITPIAVAADYYGNLPPESQNAE